jgi:Bacterial PH domain
MIRIRRQDSRERIEGIGEDLPPGEHVLWQGAPGFKRVLFDIYLFGWAAAYFAALFVWRSVLALQEGTSVAALMADNLKLLPLVLLALALLVLLAWLTVKTTIYAITSRRVVMRIGIALSLTINLPFRELDAAAVRTRADGTGDLTLSTGRNAHLAWLNLWPHARPWQLRNPEPMLRGVEQVEEVSRILARALAADADQAPVVASETAPSRPDFSGSSPAPV